MDDGLGVVRQERAEDPAEEDPGCLAGFDRRGRRLAEARVDEAMARADRGEDPGTEAPPPAGEIGE